MHRRVLGTVAAIAATVVGLAAGPAVASGPASASTGARGSAPSPWCGTAWVPYDRPALWPKQVHLADQAITASDGTRLSADVYLPADARGAVAPGKLPVLLTVTGYNKGAAGQSLGASNLLLSRGYAAVIVDDRGTGLSGGQWDSWSERTQADYSDVLQWIDAQPWAGDIGTYGASYMGLTQFFVQARHDPRVKASFAEVPMGDAYRDITFAGGQINAAFIPVWLGLVSALGLLPANLGSNPQAALGALVDHAAGVAAFQAPTVLGAAGGGDVAYDGPFWRTRSPLETVGSLSVPTFIVGGLDDIFQRGEPMLYEALKRYTDAGLLIGPWGHTNIGTVSDLTPSGIQDLDHLALRWFDGHLLALPSANVGCMPRVTQYVRGAGHDRFEVQPDWPRPDLRASRWYLHGNGSTTTSAPRSAGTQRQMLSIPVVGLCSRSTNQWLLGTLRGSPCANDNRLGELGGLTYTSTPLDAPMEINGPIEADVWLKAASKGGVVSVAVSDVAPDGTSRGLTNGLLDVRFRAVDPSRTRFLDGQSIQPWHPFTAVSRQDLVPGRATLVRVEVFPTSAVIAKGHRLRITIAPSDFPHAVSPLPAFLAGQGVVTILDDPKHPSGVVLPVVG
jgi:putative CocE/NonD family hydrolase